MPKRIIDLRSQVPLLDIVSYARGRGPLTHEQRAYIARTVRRVPEVMVKVSGGARTLAGVERHMKYVEKKGELGLETDIGTRAGGNGFARDLARDWDLDIEALNHYSKKHVRRGKPPKLVHNIVFSMPAGTSPKKVLEAVRKLALNEWALKHRYAMALHTDEPHPHVHVVVKAVSEEGERLNIKKATLRSWRAQIAANLREMGVAANATERAVRGEIRTYKRASIYRLMERSESVQIRDRPENVRTSTRASGDSLDPGAAVMSRTRKYVIRSFRALQAKLVSDDPRLAQEIGQFVDRFSPVRTQTGLIQQCKDGNDLAQSS